MTYARDASLPTLARLEPKQTQFLSTTNGDPKRDHSDIEVIYGPKRAAEPPGSADSMRR